MRWLIRNFLSLYFFTLLGYKYWAVSADYGACPDGGEAVYTFDVGRKWCEPDVAWPISKRVFDYLRHH